MKTFYTKKKSNVDSFLSEIKEDLLTVKTIAEYLCVDVKTVKNYIYDGHLKAIELPYGKNKQTFKVKKKWLREFLLTDYGDY